MSSICRHGATFLLALSLPQASGMLPHTQAEVEELLANLTANASQHNAALLLNASAKNESNSSLIQDLLNLVIGDASVERLSSLEPNTSEGCNWPTCAAYCVPCAKTNKYWTCMSSATACQVNSQCMLANCYAEPGYCYADAYPQVARCFMGAVPPRVIFNHTKFLRMGMAPPVPLPSAEFQEWLDWSLQCLVVPISLFVIYLIWAGYVFYILCFGRGIECHFLPRSRGAYILLTVICLTILVIFQVIRTVVVQDDFEAMDYQVSSLKASMHEFRNLTDHLLQAKTTYNNSLTAAAPSCGEHNPLMTWLVSSLADLLHAHFAEVHVILELTRDVLSQAIGGLDSFEARYSNFKDDYLWKPIMPLGIMVVGIIVGQLIVSYVWNSERVASSRISIHYLRLIAPIMFIVMCLFAIFSLAVFYVAVLSSGFCLNIDSNLVEQAGHIKLSDEMRETYGEGLEKIVAQTAKYYLYGTAVNPLATILQNLAAALYTVKNFYKMFEWLVEAAALSCHGIRHLSPVPLVEELLVAKEDAWDFIDAANIYPYYTKSVHTIICDGLSEQLFMVSVMTSLGGLVMCPVLAIMASNHLRTVIFAYSKDDGTFQNVEDMFGEEEAKEVHADLIAEKDLVVDCNLNSLTPLQQALVLDRVLDSRSEEVSSRLARLQAEPDSDDSDSRSVSHCSPCSVCNHSK